MKSGLMIEDPKTWQTVKCIRIIHERDVTQDIYLMLNEMDHPGFKQELSNKRNITLLIYSVNCQRRHSVYSVNCQRGLYR